MCLEGTLSGVSLEGTLRGVCVKFAVTPYVALRCVSEGPRKYLKCRVMAVQVPLYLLAHSKEHKAWHLRSTHGLLMQLMK